MSERCERTTERMSDWPSILRVDFTSFQPTVHSLHSSKRRNLFINFIKSVITASLPVAQNGRLLNHGTPVNTFTFFMAGEVH